MVNLPAQIFQHNQDLPELIQASPIPALFSDSTHQIWQCDTTEGVMILKICNQDTIQHASFWQGMNILFDVDLPGQLGEFDTLYTTVSQLSPLNIPVLIKSASATDRFPAFILCKEMDGSAIESECVNTDMCVQLAEHLVQLHQQTQTRWGRVNQTEFKASLWPKRLQQTLKHLAEKREVRSSHVDEGTILAGNIKTEMFSLIMPDLRWDQFLQHHGRMTALLDLDAFVYGPREIEFIILEYLLTPRQAHYFAQKYQSICSMPELAHVRKPYRLLLFLMNILGSRDLDAWMTAPYYW